MRLKLALVLTMLLVGGPAFAENPQDLWKAKCKTCHGEDGKAQTKMGQKESIPDFSRTAWQQAHSDDDLRAVITNGSARNPKMKAFKGKLSPAQIDALVRHIRQLAAAK